MGLEKIPGTDLEYGLISFDACGSERQESPCLMSQAPTKKMAREAVTNVFLFCHGWKGDVPAARDQYASWIGAFIACDDRQKASALFADFRPLLVGLHWPSLPWGDEELGPAAFGIGLGAKPPDLLRAYLDRLGDREEIRDPLEVIIREARRNAAPDELPPHVRAAYIALNEVLGLGSEGVQAPPDADREGFDPQASFNAANEEDRHSFGTGGIGGLLGPLRQLSYWTMKKRARSIGEGGMHRFLVGMQQATAGRDVRIHLMGHSFGTIVVSSMIGGVNARSPLPRPVDSVVLVQGAVSLWSFASEIPYGAGGEGYYHPILRDGKIRGPLVATRSPHDDAVRVFYPLASQIRGSASFAGVLPEFGAIGAYGIQGTPDGIRQDLAMAEATASYAFEKGKVYNLDGTRFICRGDGMSGAHNDIAGPEVAHSIWEAAFASV